MKKRLSFTIATVVAAMAATISTASASRTVAATDTNLQPAWEEQLQNGMEIGQETDRRLKLVGYEYLGRIGSAQEAQELVDEIFADEGIIYDNVATYAVQDVYIVDEESTNGGERGFKKEVRSVNVIDLPLWEVNLAASSTFDTEGILRDRRSHCDIYNSKGWECSAAVYFNLDKCKINESKYNEILWEYGGTDNRGAQYVTTSDGYPMGSSRASGSVVHGRE